jgi:hypothetical protein
MNFAGLLNASPRYRWRVPFGTAPIQVGRLLANRAKYALSSRQRRPELGGYYDAIDRDGIVTIPDFLRPEDFACVLREYEAVRSGESKHSRIRQYSTHGLDNWAAVMTPKDKAFQHTNRVIRNHPVIAGLTSYIIRRRIDYFPSTMSILTQNMSEGASETTDGNTYLHADVHYHTVKAVLYLNDVTEGGAPFVFAYGSHRLTKERVGLEYELATRISNPKPGQLMNGQPVVGQDLIDRFGLDVRPVYAPANTLIIADHAGLHARGTFNPGRERATLRISFRFADSLRYKFRAIFDRLRPPYAEFDPPA